MAVKITYFVHGTTTDNEKEISSGWSDVAQAFAEDWRKKKAWQPGWDYLLLSLFLLGCLGGIGYEFTFGYKKV